MIVLDACVVIAFLAPHDTHHVRAFRLLDKHAADEFVVSAITHAEILVGPARLGKESDVAGKLATIGLRVVPIGESETLDVARVRARTGLRMPDACALSAAMALRASLATFDTGLAAAARASGIAVLDD